MGFTTARCVKNNLIVMAALIALTLLVTLHPRRWTALLHFFQLSAGLFHNALLHMAATAYLGVYSPGLPSGILLYLPVSYQITKLGYRQGLPPSVPALVIFVLAPIAHARFVYTQLLTENLRL